MHAGLWLYEELFLLTLNQERGTIPVGPASKYTLIGAGLTDLLLEERIRIEKKGRSSHIVLARTSLTGEPLLDRCLERIRKSKPASVQFWVSTLVRLPDLSHGTAERLVRRGLVRREERPFLFFFTRRVYPIVNRQKRSELVERLRASLRASGEPPARDAALIALLKYAGLLGTLFDPPERRMYRNRIRQIANSHPVAGSLQSVLAAR